MMILWFKRKMITQMRRLVLILLFTVLLTIWACNKETNGSYDKHSGTITSHFDDDKDIARWWTHRGKMSIAREPKNVRKGSGALEWRYEIRDRKWNLLTINKIAPDDFKDKQGLSLWLKSDRAAPLLFQLVEKDGTNYQYFNVAKSVELNWKLWEIDFDEFVRDKDTPDENSRLDLDQIDRLEIIEVAGFFKTLKQGARTIWIDELTLMGSMETTPAPVFHDPARAVGGVSFEKGKFGLGVLVDEQEEKVVFPTESTLNPTEGTIEMWIKPLLLPSEKRAVLLSCEDAPDILGKYGNRVLLYLQRGKLIFQVNSLVLSSPKLSFTKGVFHHVAVSWNHQGTALYLDGRKIAESKNLKNLGQVSEEMIIGNSLDGNTPAQTIIDELRISGLRRDAKDIASSSGKSSELTRDESTLWLAHFNGRPLPEIDIKEADFRINKKLIFDLTIPTPDLEQSKNKLTLQFEVVDKVDIISKGKKLLALTVGEPSGQKNHVKFNINGLPRGGEYKLRLRLFSGEELLNRGEKMFMVFPLPEKERNKAVASQKEWYEKVQVYGIIPLPVAKAKAFNITVNGMWGGSHTAEPVLTKRKFAPSIREKYMTDSAFVSAMHDNGLLACGGMVTASGNNTSIKKYPQLKNAISKTPQGTDAISWLEDSYLMSAHNPIWRDWMINIGERAIDAGADLFMLDDVQEFQFPFHCGFDNYSIAEFRKYLRSNYTSEELNTRLGVVKVDDLDVKKRVTDKAGQSYETRVKADPLVDVFARFHEEKNFYAKKYAIDALRKYARKKGKKITVAANIFALGTTRFDGYWSKGLHFSELVDFFAFENLYSVGGEKVLDMPLPRGKWVAWDKLSAAATKGPAVPLLAAEAVEKLQKKKIGNYLYILTAEAYANHGAQMLWYAPSYGIGRQWKKSADAAGFVLKHRDLYEKEQSVYSPVAVLYIYTEGMKTKTFTYLGLAQALAESNIPFEVVFSGSNNYLEDTLTLHELTKYKLILIPSLIDITDKQKRVLREYVAQGGKAVLFDPRQLSIGEPKGEIKFGKGSFIVMPLLDVEGKQQDLGTAYNLTYDDMIRKRIDKTVESYVGDTIIIGGSDRKIVAYPYYQPQEKRLVIHLINYDHDLKNDKVKDKQNISIRIKEPDFYTERKTGFMFSPDFDGRIALPIVHRNGYLELKIPKLIVYDVITL